MKEEQPQAAPINVHVRGIDERLWKALLHLSIDKNVSVGALVNEALALYIGIESRIER